MLVLYLTTALGVVGFLDDFIKLRRQRNLGLNKTSKLVGQLVTALIFGDPRAASSSTPRAEPRRRRTSPSSATSP